MEQDLTLNAMLVNNFLKTLKRSATSITGFHFLEQSKYLGKESTRLVHLVAICKKDFGGGSQTFEAKEELS